MPRAGSDFARKARARARPAHLEVERVRHAHARQAGEKVRPACLHTRPLPPAGIILLRPTLPIPILISLDRVPLPGPELISVSFFSFISGYPHNSALSLRILGEDITSAARDAAAKKKQQGETVPEVAADTSVLDENADASDLAEATGVDQASD